MQMNVTTNTAYHIGNFPGSPLVPNFSAIEIDITIYNKKKDLVLTIFQYSELRVPYDMQLEYVLAKKEDKKGLFGKIYFPNTKLNEGSYTNQLVITSLKKYVLSRS